MSHQAEKISKTIMEHLKEIKSEIIKLKAENASLQSQLDDQTPKYEELLEFACEYMYKFNSGIWPDDWRMGPVIPQ